MNKSTQSQLIADLERSLRLDCDGRFHDRSLDGHVSSQPASFLIRFACPNCGDAQQVLACRGREARLRGDAQRGEDVECESCLACNPLRVWITETFPLGGPGGNDERDDPPQPPDPLMPSVEPVDDVGSTGPIVIKASESVADVDSVTWETALAEFDAFERAKNLAPRTIQNRAWVLSASAKALGKGPCDVSIEDVQARLSRGMKPSSMQSEADTYRAFFRFMSERGLRHDKLGDEIPTVRAPRRKPRPFTVEQIGAMLSSGAYGNTRAMILLAFYQGFRASEVAAVHGRDVDLEAGTISVIGKGGKHSTLPLHPDIRALAATMPRHDWWFPARHGLPGHIKSKSVSDLMHDAKIRAGIDNERLTGHSLRHSFGTELVRAGVDLRTVQELMRHETLQTTELYTAIDDEQMRAGISRLRRRTES